MGAKGRVLETASQLARKMPPVTKGGRTPTLADRPLSGLFAIAKPSGPTSMELLDKLKPLLASSALFYPTNAPAPFSSAAKKLKRPKPWEKAMLEKCGRLPPKIGQGGTLDPLAEGVLGTLLCLPSNRRRCRDQRTAAVFALHERLPGNRVARQCNQLVRLQRRSGIPCPFFAGDRGVDP